LLSFKSCSFSPDVSSKASSIAVRAKSRKSGDAISVAHNLFSKLQKLQHWSSRMQQRSDKWRNRMELSRLIVQTWHSTPHSTLPPSQILSGHGLTSSKPWNRSSWVVMVISHAKGRPAPHRSPAYDRTLWQIFLNFSPFCVIQTVIGTPSQAVHIIFEMKSQRTSQKKQ
jgi:hypothetical protein